MIERLELVTRELDQLEYNDDDLEDWIYIDEIYNSIEAAIIALEEVRDSLC